MIVKWWFIQCNLQIVSSNSFNADILGSVPSIKCLGINTNITPVLCNHMVSCMWSDMIDAAEISICRQESGYSRRFRSDRDGHRKHTAVRCEGSCWSHSGSGGKSTSTAGISFWLACILYGRIVPSRLLYLRGLVTIPCLKIQRSRRIDNKAALLFGQYNEWLNATLKSPSSHNRRFRTNNWTYYQHYYNYF